MMKKQRSNIDEREFNSIHELLDRGVTAAQLRTLTGWSHATIDRVKLATSWANYKVILKELRDRQDARKLEVTPETPVDPTIRTFPDYVYLAVSPNGIFLWQTETKLYKKLGDL